MLPALRSQLGELDRMRREMDRLWESVTREHYPSTFNYDWLPSLDLSARGDSLVDELEVPGIDPGDIDISVTGDLLTVVFGIPAIIGGGLVWKLAGNWQMVFVYLCFLGFVLLALLLNPEKVVNEIIGKKKDEGEGERA